MSRPPEAQIKTDSGDLRALAAVVCMYIKLLHSPQRYPRILSELLTAFAALLARRRLDDVPTLHSASTV